MNRVFQVLTASFIACLVVGALNTLWPESWAPVHAQTTQSGFITSMNDTFPSAACFHQDSGGPETCVPMSILRAEFKEWRSGDAPPVLDARQALIAVQRQYADALQRLRECEGTLGPLQARIHAEAIDRQQADLNAALVAAAPPKMKWDPITRKYLPMKE